MEVYKVRVYNKIKGRYELAYAMSENGKKSVVEEFEKRLKSGFRVASVTKCHNIAMFDA